MWCSSAEVDCVVGRGASSHPDMAHSNPLPAEADDDEGVFEAEGVFDADEVLRRELEEARTCYLQNRENKFCTLCRTRRRSKEIVLSHLIPYSVLKAGGDNHAIGTAGQEVSRSKRGYRGYCKQCERMLSDKGERNFNQLMHVPLLRDYNSTVHVEGDQVVGVYHCALSVWWRLSSLYSELACEKSSKGKDYRKLLEHVRVWLHNPREAFPAGLQVVFVALHPDDIHHLQTLDLHLAATKVYGGLMDLRSKYVTSVHMGPLLCMYMFMRLSVVISPSIHIAEGNARSPFFNRAMMQEHMKEVKECMLNMEARASNQAQCSSNPVEEVASLDLIPPHIAVICSEGVHFQYHRLVHQISYPSRTGGNSIQLDLYKHKGKQGDGPPYEAMASIPTKNGGLIRIWLQSNTTGTKFEIHKDTPLRRLDKGSLKKIKKLVAIFHI